MANSTPQDLLNTLARAFYEDRDVETILRCVTDDIEWIGTEDNEIASGKTELRQMLELSFARYPKIIQVKLDEPRVHKIGTDSVLLVLSGKKLSTPEATARFPLRGTLACVQTRQGWLVSSLHMSSPNAEVEKESLLGALEAERVKQSELLNNVPGGVGIYDIHDGIATLQYLNNAYLSMMGLKLEDRVQYFRRDITEVVHPEDQAALRAMLWDIQGGKAFTQLLFRVRNGSGKWKWINLELRAMREENGHYTGYANLSDFDEVVRVRQEMEAAHKKEETLLAGIPGGIAIYHIKKDGKVFTEYVSESLAKMCGYTAAEFLDYLKVDAMINLVAEDVPAVREALMQSLAEHRNLSVTYRIYKKDKTPLLIRLEASTMENEPLAEDEIAVLYAVHTVVSAESKRIIDEQRFLNRLLNSVPAGVGVFRVENGTLTQEYMNDAFFEILHSTRESRNRFSGANAMAAIHPDDMAAVRKGIGGLLRGADTMQVDYRLINGLGGYTWFSVTASVTERKNGYIRFFTAFSNCTESKKQELQLLQNQRAVELAQSLGNMAIWTYNIDEGVILQQIHSEEKSSLGYQIRVENVPECFVRENNVYPEDVEKFLNAYRELADGAESVDVTYRLKNKRTDKYEWVRMSYRRMENNGQNERMAVGFSMNVDKEQEAIERYRVEHTLRDRLNENVLMYMEYNLTKDRFESNGKTEGSYFKSEQESDRMAEYLAGLSKTVDEAYLEKLAEKMSARSLLKAFEAGESKVSVEFRGRAEQGDDLLWYSATTILVKRPDTGDIMAFVTVESIETQKDRQLAIESSLSDGVESVAIIHLADEAARLILENGNRLTEEKEKHMPYNEDFVRRSSMVVTPDEREFSYNAALLSTVMRELEKREIYQYTVTTRLPGRASKRQLFRFRYLDDRKTNVIMSISDVTSVYLEDRKKKKRLEEALFEAQKASHAKADFYSRMSHDMRTPMNGILGMAELSESETDGAKLRENIGKIKESGQYLLSLINDTLDIQRIESGKMKLEPAIVNAGDVQRNILEMVEVTAGEKGVRLLNRTINTDLNWYIRADALRLKQVFINLLSNAIKFTPAGGTVSLDFELLSMEGAISHNVVYVRDTGVGMSKEFLKTGIFKPFSQESNAVSATYAGSGLGLSIAKSLVELMGGRIEVESELGKGTTFAVYLDFERVAEADAKSALQSAKKKSQNTSEQLKGKEILLAEDHPLNAEIATKLLQKVGCRVTWAQNGREALTLFANAPVNTFDAILMDIRMPVMDGLEASRQIRALDKADAASVPIIAMTANAYEEDRKASLDAGMNVHLGKPIEPKTLYDTLAVCLHKEG